LRLGWGKIESTGTYIRAVFILPWGGPKGAKCKKKWGDRHETVRKKIHW